MRKVLIANRGEIAVRVIHACAEAGLESVAVYADPDAEAPHVELADHAYALAGTSPAETYLNQRRLLEIARETGADAVHPGYGFLSENADFAQAVIDSGLTWIGPNPQSIRTLGDKVQARAIAQRVGAPLVPGSDGPVETADQARLFAEEHGLPVIIKAAHGGGGRGMRVVRDLADVEGSFTAAAREADGAFGRPECFIERYLDRPRHVEAQILADTHGNVVVLGTRDCSLQRRHQKLVEEAPAPFLTDDQRQRIHTAAARIAQQAGYVGAGTAEFLVGEDGLISFLEVNTRLQVEHPVTEAVYGVDLVRAQFEIADGGFLPVLEPGPPRGHAFEFRINAEDPGRGFLPSGGTVEALDLPTGPGIRVDSGVRSGSPVATTFDSMLLKVIVHGDSRRSALTRAARALAELRIRGVSTTLPFHRTVLEEPEFTSEDDFAVHTGWIESSLLTRLESDPDYRPNYLDAEDNERLRMVIDVDGRRMTLGLPEEVLAGLGGAASSLSSGAAAQSAARTENDDAEITAPMTGQVLTWLVGDGEVAQKGQGVVVLEVMKTETTVSAAVDGTVEHRVSVGDAVDQGQLLAVLR